MFNMVFVTVEYDEDDGREEYQRDYRFDEETTERLLKFLREQAEVDG